MNKKILTLLFVGALVCTPLTFTDIDADGNGFDITDDTGRTFHFDGPAEKIALNGAGAMLTIAGTGMVDKVVAVDKYSTYTALKDERLKDMDAVDLGSFYSETNHEGIIVELINLVENNRMSKDDPIILTAASLNEKLRDKLENKGFTKVMVWKTADILDYNGIIDFVKDISMIVTGEESDVVKDMNAKVAQVETMVTEASEKPKVLPLWYSTSAGFQINNVGIATSMLEVCGADHIGYVDNGKTRYGDKNTIIDILADNPGTIIFLPSSWQNANKTVADFYQEFNMTSGQFKVVQMGAQWNNYCPESADGLVLMAEALYMDGGDGTGSGSGDDNTNIMMWIVVIVVVAAIAAAAYMAFKRTHGNSNDKRQ